MWAHLYVIIIYAALSKNCGSGQALLGSKGDTTAVLVRKRVRLRAAGMAYMANDCAGVAVPWDGGATDWV